MYTDYRINDENVKDYEKYEEAINTIHKRFRTYGYKRIKTSTFEQYDLYSKVKSSLDQNEMIKVINRTGEVLVLRPDVTIPITRKLAEDLTELSNEIRYFYVQDVFRHVDDRREGIESTQAGVEYFCESSPEADAEVIALAVHTLKDLNFKNIKIEIGHAGFFKQLIEELNLTAAQLTQLKKAIQSKNVVDIESFLSTLSIKQEIREAIVMIPFLYGNPKEVSEKARDLVESPKLHKTLDYLMDLYTILAMYGIEDYVVLDLGLINHMDYYSGVIFQGFVGKYGKPVLMGGRYDGLGNEFGANLPAIGFACEVESLLEASESDEFSPQTPIDVIIKYDQENLNEAIQISNELRASNYSVLSSSLGTNTTNNESKYDISIANGTKTFNHNEKQSTFTNMAELLVLMNDSKGSI